MTRPESGNAAACPTNFTLNRFISTQLISGPAAAATATEKRRIRPTLQREAPQLRGLEFDVHSELIHLHHTGKCTSEVNHPTQTTTVPSLSTDDDYDVLGFTPPPRHDCPQDPIPALSFECASRTTDKWGLSFALGDQDHGLFGGDSFRSLVSFFKALGPSLPHSLDEIIAAILVGRSERCWISDDGIKWE